MVWISSLVHYFLLLFWRSFPRNVFVFGAHGVAPNIKRTINDGYGTHVCSVYFETCIYLTFISGVKLGRSAGNLKMSIDDGFFYKKAS